MESEDFIALGNYVDVRESGKKDEEDFPNSISDDLANGIRDRDEVAELETIKDGPIGGDDDFLKDDNDVEPVLESISATSQDVNNFNYATLSESESGAVTKKGVKRSRVESDEQPPSVHVSFNSLTRESKRKLEELLQQWSAWDAKHCPSHGSNEVLESGEATYYPALNVDLDKQSTMYFWLDNHTSTNKEFSQVDEASVPVYDRGYAFALTSGDGNNNLIGDSELIDESRCFNCGSYGHSLKECTKPRDHAAVKNARIQHKRKNNQNTSSRTPSRYYKNSQSGKFDGLRPGVLEAATRKLLGLGELDPPPWLERMREIGYPPGYLEDNEDQPSGLFMFGDEDTKVQEMEDGEIQDMELSPPPESRSPLTLPKKMTVSFPGINAPIPANASRRLWEPVNSSTDSYPHRSSRKFSYSSDSASRDQLGKPQWSRDDGPSVVSASVYSYSSRYASYNPTDRYRSPRRDMSPSRSSTFERSTSDRGRRSPPAHEGFSARASYHSLFYPPKDDLQKIGDDRSSYSNGSSRHSHRGGEHHHRTTR